MSCFRTVCSLLSTFRFSRNVAMKIEFRCIRSKPNHSLTNRIGIFRSFRTMKRKRETGEEKRKKKKRRGRLSKRGLGQECRPSGKNSKTRRLLDGWGKGMVSLWRENAGPFLSQPNSSSALSFHIYIFRQKIFRVKRKLKENPLTRITCGWWRGKR